MLSNTFAFPSSFYSNLTTTTTTTAETPVSKTPVTTTKTDAPPPVRDLIDMTDATAQAAFKKAIAIDAAADQLMDASDQLLAELAVTATGTAPMIEAQSAAMLVKAHALTQSATAELFRIRAIDMANTGASLKFNANHASDTRRDITNMFVK